jgi:hypothetical protein
MRPVRLAIRADAGLTLVETMLALTILLCGLLALLAPMHRAAASLNNSQAIATALEIAARRMEQIKQDPVGFFQAVPDAERPQAPLAANGCTTPCIPNLWHHQLLDRDFGTIPGHPEMASFVLLESNVTDNTAVVRIPVIWRRVGGAWSTSTGEPFDPLRPDTPAAIVELVSVIQYRSAKR